MFQSFPTTLRATGVGSGEAFMRLGGALVPFVTQVSAFIFRSNQQFARTFSVLFCMNTLENSSYINSLTVSAFGSLKELIMEDENEKSLLIL